ncbi:hypothetical protein R1flu_010860 [Riccia fluitans]|uniref:Uncharacterized protein n=1 Tax=Riccia fluitans TaxID=41844 RepID=A0ABD1Z662_9MARC
MSSAPPHINTSPMSTAEHGTKKPTVATNKAADSSDGESYNPTNEHESLTSIKAARSSGTAYLFSIVLETDRVKRCRQSSRTPRAANTNP